MGYKKVIVTSTAWMVVLRLVTQGLIVLKLIVVARILTPQEFGIFAAIVAVLTIVDTLTDLGLSYAAIHMQLDLKKVARTYLFTTAVRGGILSLIALLLMPLASLFFNDHRVGSLLLISAVIPFLKGFINPYVLSFQKDLKFNKEFLFRLIPSVIATLSTILFVVLYHNAFALVLGLVVGTVSELVLSYIMADRNFENPYSSKYLKKLFSYGKWITAGGFFSYLTTQLDTITIGRLLGVSSLGLYDIAFKTGSTAFNEITNVISQIMFPVYSKIYKDKPRLRNLFLRHISLTTVAAFCLNLPLFLFPSEVINILFGPKWLGATDVLRVLSLYGFLKASIGPVGPLLLSIGMPRTLAKLSTIHFLILLTLIFPLVLNFQITGAAIAMTVSYALIAPYYLYKTYIFLKK